VKRGGFASVLGLPSDAANHPEVKIETMEVKPAPGTLARVAEAVNAGKLQIPIGQRFALSDAGKVTSCRGGWRGRQARAACSKSSRAIASAAVFAAKKVIP